MNQDSYQYYFESMPENSIFMEYIIFPLIIFLIVLLLFGKGKIPSLMADMAKGIKSFKSNMAEDDKPTNPDKDDQDNQNKDQ